MEAPAQEVTLPLQVSTHLRQNRQPASQMDGQIERWMNGQMERQMDGQIERQMDGQIERQMDGQMDIYSHVSRLTVLY